MRNIRALLFVALLAVAVPCTAVAADTYFPTAGTYGTLAYEDKWPGKGDYDMNDMVVEYNIHLVNDPVTSMDIVTRVEARGASYHIGFAISLPAGVTVGSATLLSTSTACASGVSISPEPGVTPVSFKLFDDAFALLPSPNGCHFVNTDDPTSNPLCVGTSKEFTLHVVFSGTLPTSAALLSVGPTVGINPFIFKDVNAGKRTEIHLANYPPTSAMDHSLFGTFDDATTTSGGVGTGNWFKTANGLPWALDISSSFVWPKETKPVNTAYLHFVAWATSAGTSFADWYSNVAGGYRDTNVLRTTAVTDEVCSCLSGYALINGVCVAAAFSPLDLAPMAWYDGKDIGTIIKDGSSYVSQWNDKSGYNHNLAQTTGTYQPLFSATDGIFFDGTDYMDATSTSC